MIGERLVLKKKCTLFVKHRGALCFWALAHESKGEAKGCDQPDALPIGQVVTQLIHAMAG